MLRKLGPHIRDVTDVGVRWAKGANIVKVLDHAYLLRDCRPDALTIYRRYFDIQDLGRHGADVAREVIRDCQEAGVRPSFLELFNEQYQEGDDYLARHIDFTAEALPVLRDFGSELAAFSFGTGRPKDQQASWELLRERNYGGARVIALHEYWDGPFDEWNALRHRQVHRWTNGQHPPFLLTEVGRDSLRDGAPAGWRQQDVTAEQYRAELEAYDHELCQDDYVIGGTVFTAGGSGTWEPFDVDPLGVPETVPAQLWPT